MKSFRKYLKEDVHLITQIGTDSSIGFSIGGHLETLASSKGKARFGLIFGAHTIGADKTFDKDVGDEKTAKEVFDKDKAAIQSLINTVVKDAESQIKRELAKMGYKAVS